MDVRKFIAGGKFSEYQHFVIMTRDRCGMIPMGGGYPQDIVRRFGDEKIIHVSIYENIVRVEVN